MFWFHRSTQLFQSQISSVESSCSLYQHCKGSQGSCCCWRNNATCEYKIQLLLLLSSLILLFALIWQTSVTVVNAVQILLWQLTTIHLLHIELWITVYILSAGFLDTLVLIRITAWSANSMLFKFLKQNCVFQEDLNWVQHNYLS